MENSNGFGVVTGELTDYAQHTKRLATELHALATHQVRSVRGGHGFGPIGQETGFVTALDHFAKALAEQLTGAAKTADGLGDSVAEAARDYQERDEERAQELVDMIRGDKR